MPQFFGVLDFEAQLRSVLRFSTAPRFAAVSPYHRRLRFADVDYGFSVAL